jgi:hypothetical protein
LAAGQLFPGLFIFNLEIRRVAKIRTYAIMNDVAIQVRNSILAGPDSPAKAFLTAIEAKKEKLRLSAIKPTHGETPLIPSLDTPAIIATPSLLPKTGGEGAVTTSRPSIFCNLDDSTQFSPPKAIDWAELSREAAESEARPVMAFASTCGNENPEWSEDYQHPKDGIPF